MGVLITCLIVASLAVVRLTTLLTRDELTIGYRRFIIKRFGDQSKMSYLAHCDWCTSMWIAPPILFVAAAWPNRWVLAALFCPVASLAAGLLSKLRD